MTPRTSALVLASLFVALPAFADTNESKAEALFQQGKDLLTAKNFVAACPLLAESYRLDPAGGTLQNLAVCYEEIGKWVSANARFEELRSLSKNARPPRQDRIDLAEAHLEKLRPKLTRIVIDAPADPALKVRVDDVLQSRASYTDGVLVDPGQHEVSATAPDYEDWSTKVLVSVEHMGTSLPVRIPPLTHRPILSTTTHPTRAVGAMVGSVGIAALVAGGILGILTLNKSGDADAICRGPGTTGSDCFSGSPQLASSNKASHDALVLANATNIAIGVGLVATVVGGWLFFRTKTTPRLTGSF